VADDVGGDVLGHSGVFQQGGNGLSDRVEGVLERVTMRGPDASRLFGTIRDGSGELQEIVRTDGWQPPTNLRTNGKNNAYADNVRSYWPAGTDPEAITNSKQSR